MGELEITFRIFPQFFGSEDSRGGDDIVADDPVVRIVRVTCRTVQYSIVQCSTVQYSHQ